MLKSLFIKPILQAHRLMDNWTQQRILKFQSHLKDLFFFLEREDFDPNPQDPIINLKSK